MKLFDLYILTPRITKDYAKYNGSVEGLHKILNPLYTGMYQLLTYKDTYCIGIIVNGTLITLFWGSSGNNDVIDIYKNRDKLKEEFGIKQIMIKFDLKKNKRQFKFLDKISKETFITYLI